MCWTASPGMMLTDVERRALFLLGSGPATRSPLKSAHPTAITPRLQRLLDT